MCVGTLTWPYVREEEVNVPKAVSAHEILEGHLIGYVGGGLVIGGSIQNTPPVYASVVDTLLASIDHEPYNDQWDQWWAKAGEPPCLIFAWIGGPRTEIRVRRTRDRVTAQIERATEMSDQGGPLDPGIEAALADVKALFDKLRSRFDLPATPPFPEDWRDKARQKSYS